MATYYVATTGDNANDGSIGSPWLTINYAASRPLNPGDTVIVKAGTYNTSGINLTKNGSAAGGYITFKSEVRGGAKVISSGDNGFLFATPKNTPNRHHVRIEGFDVSGAKTGINVSKCYYVEIVDNICHNNVAQAIYVRESEFILIEGNESFGNNQLNVANNSISVHFMQNASGDTTTSGYRMIVRGNYAHENGIGTSSTDGGGIMVDQNPTDDFTPLPYDYPRLVENNICWGNAGPGIIILEALNTLVRCNTCWHNGHKPTAGGFVGNLVNRGDNITWVNNIAVADKAYNPSSPAISIPVLANRTPQVYIGVEWYNNITFNGVNGETSLFSMGGNSVNYPTVGNGNLLGVNPQLVAPGSANFRPATGSPAINGGTSAHSGVPAEDFDGVTRTGTPDIGAYNVADVTGTMAPNSIVCVAAYSRAAQTDMAADVALGGVFTQETVRNASPASWVGTSAPTLLDEFGPVAKTTSAQHQGAMVAAFSMTPNP